MEIKQFKFWDYFIYRNKIKYSNIFYDIFTGLYLKIIQDKKVIMIWKIEYIDSFVAYINNIIKLKKTNDKAESIKLKGKLSGIKFIYESCNDGESSLSDYGFKLEDSNITMILNKSLQELDLDIDSKCNLQDISFLKFEKGLHDKIRCDIQNKVFYNKYRMPLSIKDIKYEYSKRFFLDNLAIFIRENHKIVGYGQVLFLEGKYTIANVGILEEYQGKGYGKLLIKKLLILAKEENISQLYIKVKESNKIAMKLYKDIGFEEITKVDIYTIA